MQDLTEGSIPRHLFRLAAPIGIGMVFQTLYFLIDLYFVARLGDHAIAGVSSGGNLQFLIMALTQVLGVGTMALIAHASGRKDRHDANLIFNQSVLLAALMAVITLIAGYASAGWYMSKLGADAETAQAGREYLFWFLPGLALQFAAVAMGSALRGTGIAKPTMVVQVITVVCNAVLAPVLIAGWGTGLPMGVAGAGLASTIAIALGVVMMIVYFVNLESFVGFERALLKPRADVWARMLRVGLPPGGEFALMFVYMAVIYALIAGFGAHAQAGFGVGSRVMQAIFLPAMAVAFATAPLAGQNIGAGKIARAREAFHTSVLIGSVIMLLLTVFCQWQPALFVRWFTDDPEVIAVAVGFLGVISFNFIAQGVIFTCAGMFQAMGNTLPSLMSSASRLLTFVLPSVWLSTRPGFTLRQVWIVSVFSVTVQAVLSYVLLRRSLTQREEKLAAMAPAPA